MVFHIAVTDDIPADAQKLAGDIRRIFSNYPQHHVSIQVFDSAESMLSFGAGSFQMAFLDILMDGMNGIELAKKLRAADINMLIVFLTSSPEYAFEAFPVHPFDYLVKPVSPQRLDRMLDEACRLLSPEAPTVTVRVARGELVIPLDNVFSAVSQGHAVELCLSDGQRLRCLMTFSDLERELSRYPRFLMCNRGILINMDCVSSLDGDLVRLRDGSTYPLRVRGRTELVSRFSQYQISRMRGGRPG